MRSDPHIFVFGVIAAVLCGGMEVLLPGWAGVGFPALLVAAEIMAVRGGTFVAAEIFALAAGAAEDALCALPPMTSASYFMLVAALLRWTGFSWGVMLFAYPVYQLWLEVWTGAFGAGVFYRILVSVPVGLVTALVVGAAMTWATGKAAVGESE